MSKSVSPPPLKRRKIADVTSASGPTPVVPLPLSRLRIFSWNVNGIAPFLQPSITSFFASEEGQPSRADGNCARSIRDVLQRYDWPVILHLQEVKLSPDDTTSRRSVEKAVSRRPDEPADSPSYRAYFCLPKDEFNARGFGRKVYGVCSILREDFVTHYGVKVREVNWDLEGRFLICQTEARDAVPALAIFNCYMVNGTDAPYKNSKTGEVEGTRHDRKLHVHELLHAECRQLEAEGVAVVLAGDMNVARTRLDGHPNLRTHPAQHCTNRADFETKFFQDAVGTESLRMIDTFRELHPRKAGYTYYPRQTSFGASCDRVDLIMLSRSLRHHLSAAGMMATPADRGPSEHVPLYAELEFASWDDRGDQTVHE